MRKNIGRLRGLSAARRFGIVLPAVVALALMLGCQTPPKKTKGSTAVAHHGSARESALDLFSASAERFGSDPRTTRPVLVSDTVWIVVGGSLVIISAIALVSAARGARAGRSSRRRT